MQTQHNNTPNSDGEQIVRDHFNVAGEENGPGDHDVVLLTRQAEELAAAIDQKIQSEVLKHLAHSTKQLTQYVATHFSHELRQALIPNIEPVAVSLLGHLQSLRKHSVTEIAEIRQRYLDDPAPRHYKWLEPTSMTGAMLEPGVAFARLVVGVVGGVNDWSAYYGPHDWPIEHIADYGSKLTRQGANNIFPTARDLNYRE